MASGDLPVLRRLVDCGQSTLIENFAGFGNGVFWPAFATGGSPADYGRYFWRQIRTGSYEIERFDDETQIKQRPFWGALDDAGKKVAVIDAVRAPLAHIHHGIEVSDWFAHDRISVARSSPPDLIDKVIAEYGDDPFDGTAFDTNRSSAECWALTDRLEERIGTKMRLLTRLLTEESWDLFMPVFGEPHDVGHHCWHLHDPQHAGFDAEMFEQRGDPILRIYKVLDEAMGRLIEAAGPDARIFVVTGPGMQPNDTANHLLDPILRRLEAGPKAATAAKVDRIGSLYELLLPKAVRRLLSPLAQISRRKVNQADYASRKFFVVPHNANAGAIRINLVGREPQGKVHRGAEYDQVCADLTRDLLEIRNADSGGPLVSRVIRVDQVVSGPYLDDMPDLLVEWHRPGAIRAARSEKIGEVYVPSPFTRTGDHTPFGLFATSSPAKNLPDKLAPSEIAPLIKQAVLA